MQQKKVFYALFVTLVLSMALPVWTGSIFAISAKAENGIKEAIVDADDNEQIIVTMNKPFEKSIGQHELGDVFKIKKDENSKEGVWFIARAHEDEHNQTKVVMAFHLKEHEGKLFDGAVVEYGNQKVKIKGLPAKPAI